MTDEHAPSYGPPVSPALVILGAFGVAILLGVLLGKRLFLDRFSYVQVIEALVALGLARSLLGGRRGVERGVMIWICTLALGYRTMGVVPGVKVHPSEVLIWALFGGLIVWGGEATFGRSHIWVPRWVRWFVPFWLWGWAPWLGNTLRWQDRLIEFQQYVALVPLCAVLAHVLSSPANLRRIVGAFFAVGVWIGALGLAEYVFPGIRSLCPAFITGTEADLSAEGFARAAFSFFGAPSAAFVLVVSIPMGIAMWGWRRSPVWRLAILAGFLAQAGGIYISGYRSMWLTLMIQVLLLTVLYRRLGVLLLMLLLCPVAFRALPAATQMRFHSLEMALVQGQSDSSAQKRWNRADAAWELTLSQPLGAGWGAAGWAHCDFLQLSANLGIPAALLLIGAYLWAVASLAAQVWSREAGRDPTDVAVLLALVAAGGLLAMEGVMYKPQLGLPVWFVWVLAEVRLRQAAALRAGAAAAQTGRAAA